MGNPDCHGAIGKDNGAQLCQLTGRYWTFKHEEVVPSSVSARYRWSWRQQLRPQPQQLRQLRPQSRQLQPPLRPLSAASMRRSWTMFVWNALPERQAPANMMHLEILPNAMPLLAAPMRRW